MATVSNNHLATAVLGASALAVGVVLWRRRSESLKAIVTQLNVYPIKSCRGIALEKAVLDDCGIQHDREWVIVRAPSQADDLAEMLTIRDLPRMACIQPSFTSQGKLMISTDDGKSLVVEGDNHGVMYKSRVWRTDVIGIDQGGAVSDFLSNFLNCRDKPVKLIRMAPEHRRSLIDCSKYSPIVSKDADQGGFSNFSDWSQLSLVSNQTITWLNMQETICGGMSNARFRMNIVVDAAGAFAEDKWQWFTIRDIDFQFLKQCGRCAVPTVDPSDGTKDENLEPLKTLKKRRAGYYPHLGSGDTQAFLGTNLRHMHKSGQCIRVGDCISVAAWR